MGRSESEAVTLGHSMQYHGEGGGLDAADRRRHLGMRGCLPSLAMSSALGLLLVSTVSCTFLFQPPSAAKQGMTPPVMRSPSLLGPLGVPLPIRTSTPHRSPARKPALNALPISSVALLPQSASLSWLLPLVFAGLMAVTLRVVAHSRCTLPPMLRKPPSIPNVHSIWTAVEAAGHGSTVCVVDEHHGKPAFQATFSEMRHLIETAAAALQGIGVQHGSMVAVFSENSHRWLVVDHAVSMCGGVSAVRGAGAPVEELVYILQNSEATFLVVENSALLRQLVGAMPAEQFASLRAVVVLYEKDPAALRDVEGAMQAAAGEGAERLRVLGFEEVVSQGKAQQFMPVTVLPSDLVTLVYTSGTTGKPKGAMLTHANLLTQAVLNSFHLLASPNTHDPRPGDIYLSILPCWHVFERAAECFMLYHGATLVYTTKLRFKSDMLKHRPHYLIAVPRIFDVVHSGVQQKLKAKPAVVQRVIGFLTAAAKRHHTARRTFTNMDLSTRIRFPDGPGLLRRAAALLTMALTYPLARLADLLVFQKVREAIGGRVKVACSGGASLPMHLDEFYDIVGLKVLVGYGLTETSPTVACRSVDHNMIGTCGFAAFSELRVVDEETGKPVPPLTSGLVQAKGPQVFSGYYHNPEATAKAFTEDGFFDTGDSGFLLRTGELVLSGRVKDIIVLSNGENIEPSPIEDAITASPLVDQVMLVGQGQRGLGALVVPNMPELRGRGLITASDLTQYEGLVAANDVAALGEFAHRLESQLALWKALHREINAHVHGRVGYRPDEQIIDFRLVLTPFSIENQQLTQTLKVRRNVVEHDFEHLIAAMFARPEV